MLLDRAGWAASTIEKFADGEPASKYLDRVLRVGATGNRSISLLKYFENQSAKYCILMHAFSGFRVGCSALANNELTTLRAIVWFLFSSTGFRTTTLENLANTERNLRISTHFPENVSQMVYECITGAGAWNIGDRFHGGPLRTCCMAAGRVTSARERERRNEGRTSINGWAKSYSRLCIICYWLISIHFSILNSPFSSSMKITSYAGSSTDIWLVYCSETNRFWQAAAACRLRVLRSGDVRRYDRRRHGRAHDALVWERQEDDVARHEHVGACRRLHWSVCYCQAVAVAYPQTAASSGKKMGAGSCNCRTDRCKFPTEFRRTAMNFRQRKLWVLKSSILPLNSLK